MKEKTFLVYRRDTGAVGSLVHVRLMPGAPDPGADAIRQDVLATAHGSAGEVSGSAGKLEVLEIDPSVVRPGAEYIIDPATQAVKVTERDRAAG